jgi:hypothetical protein
MGLDTSHNAWHGAYSAFSRWRHAIWRAAGYKLNDDPRPPSTEGYPDINWDAITNDNLQGKWDSTPEDPLIVLIAHSDYDGVIYPAQAGPLADRLEELLPQIVEDGEAWGHIERDGGLVAVTRRFIGGLRAAAAAGEPLEFG